MSVNLFVRKRDKSKRCDTYKGARYLLIWDFVDIEMKTEGLDSVVMTRDDQTIA